jgi:hypothetical protein
MWQSRIPKASASLMTAVVCRCYAVDGATFAN